MFRFTVAVCCWRVISAVTSYLYAAPNGVPTDKSEPQFAGPSRAQGHADLFAAAAHGEAEPDLDSLQQAHIPNPVVRSIAGVAAKMIDARVTGARAAERPEAEERLPQGKTGGVRRSGAQVVAQSQSHELGKPTQKQPQREPGKGRHAAAPNIDAHATVKDASNNHETAQGSAQDKQTEKSKAVAPVPRPNEAEKSAADQRAPVGKNTSMAGSGAKLREKPPVEKGVPEGKIVAAVTPAAQGIGEMPEEKRGAEKVVAKSQSFKFDKSTTQQSHRKLDEGQKIADANLGAPDAMKDSAGNPSQEKQTEKFKAVALGAGQSAAEQPAANQPAHQGSNAFATGIGGKHEEKPQVQKGVPGGTIVAEVKLDAQGQGVKPEEKRGSEEQVVAKSQSHKLDKPTTQLSHHELDEGQRVAVPNLGAHGAMKDSADNHKTAKSPSQDKQTDKFKAIALGAGHSVAEKPAANQPALHGNDALATGIGIKHEEKPQLQKGVSEGTIVAEVKLDAQGKGVKPEEKRGTEQVVANSQNYKLDKPTEQQSQHAFEKGQTAAAHSTDAYATVKDSADNHKSAKGSTQDQQAEKSKTVALKPRPNAAENAVVDQRAPPGNIASTAGGGVKIGGKPQPVLGAPEGKIVAAVKPKAQGIGEKSEEKRGAEKVVANSQSYKLGKPTEQQSQHIFEKGQTAAAHSTDAHATVKDSADSHKSAQGSTQDQQAEKSKTLALMPRPNAAGKAAVDQRAPPGNNPSTAGSGVKFGDKPQPEKGAPEGKIVAAVKLNAQGIGEKSEEKRGAEQVVANSQNFKLDKPTDQQSQHVSEKGHSAAAHNNDAHATVKEFAENHKSAKGHTQDQQAEKSKTVALKPRPNAAEKAAVDQRASPVNNPPTADSGIKLGDKPQSEKGTPERKSMAAVKPNAQGIGEKSAEQRGAEKVVANSQSYKLHKPTEQQSQHVSEKAQSAAALNIDAHAAVKDSADYHKSVKGPTQDQQAEKSKTVALKPRPSAAEEATMGQRAPPANNPSTAGSGIKFGENTQPEKGTLGGKIVAAMKPNAQGIGEKSEEKRGGEKVVANSQSYNLDKPTEQQSQHVSEKGQSVAAHNIDAHATVKDSADNHKSAKASTQDQQAEKSKTVALKQRPSAAEKAAMDQRAPLGNNPSTSGSGVKLGDKPHPEKGTPEGNNVAALKPIAQGIGEKTEEKRGAEKVVDKSQSHKFDKPTKQQSQHEFDDRHIAEAADINAHVVVKGAADNDESAEGPSQDKKAEKPKVVELGAGQNAAEKIAAHQHAHQGNNAFAMGSGIKPQDLPQTEKGLSGGKTVAAVKLDAPGNGVKPEEKRGAEKVVAQSQSHKFGKPREQPTQHELNKGHNAAIVKVDTHATVKDSADNREPAKAPSQDKHVEKPKAVALGTGPNSAEESATDQGAPHGNSSSKERSRVKLEKEPQAKQGLFEGKVAAAAKLDAQGIREKSEEKPKAEKASQPSFGAAALKKERKSLARVLQRSGVQSAQSTSPMSIATMKGAAQVTKAPQHVSKSTEEKKTPQQIWNVTKEKETPQQASKFARPKTTPQQLLNITNQKETPQNTLKITEEKKTPQQMQKVTEKKETSQLKMRRILRRKRIAAAAQKEVTKEKGTPQHVSNSTEEKKTSQLIWNVTKEKDTPLKVTEKKETSQLKMRRILRRKRRAAAAKKEVHVEVKKQVLEAKKQVRRQRRSRHKKMSLRQKTAIAESAAFGAEGFQTVAAKKSSAAMSEFVHGLVKSNGLVVRDEQLMQRIMPYFTGECANRSYHDLLEEVAHATENRICHPAWLGAAQQESSPALSVMQYAHVQAEPRKVAYTLFLGIITELGGEVLPGRRRRLWGLAQAMVRSDSNSRAFMEALRVSKMKHQWLKWRKGPRPRRGGQVTFDLKGGARKWITNVGKAAPLNEHGFKAVRYTRNNGQMSIFIRRVARDAGFSVLDDARLRELTPYFTGVCAHLPYSALFKKLPQVSAASVVTQAAFELASDHARSSEEVRRAIHQTLGFDLHSLEVKEAASAQEAMSSSKDTHPSKSTAKLALASLNTVLSNRVDRRGAPGTQHGVPSETAPSVSEAMRREEHTRMALQLLRFKTAGKSAVASHNDVQSTAAAQHARKHAVGEMPLGTRSEAPKALSNAKHISQVKSIGKVSLAALSGKVSLSSVSGKRKWKRNKVEPPLGRSEAANTISDAMRKDEQTKIASELVRLKAGVKSAGAANTAAVEALQTTAVGGMLSAKQAPQLLQLSAKAPIDAFDPEEDESTGVVEDVQTVTDEEMPSAIVNEASTRVLSSLVQTEASGNSALEKPKRSSRRAVAKNLRKRSAKKSVSVQNVNKAASTIPEAQRQQEQNEMASQLTRLTAESVKSQADSEEEPKQATKLPPAYRQHFVLRVTSEGNESTDIVENVMKEALAPIGSVRFLTDPVIQPAPGHSALCSAEFMLHAYSR